MWNSYLSESISKEEKELILSFISQCFSFIDNCIHYNIINITVHPPMPCVEPPSVDETPITPVSTPALSSTISELSETPSISYVCVGFKR